ncbi:hypothetical protein EDD16DRAFT_1516527 [Pisolithus croceorrhizus]|nr:hypothetical protein EDD16DRAFT_1516527 [Pisolithus croceorrhizus]KAI6150027.1 hypothetical protein EDD17DRAFT_1513722 [Pisolithus thermaeus]
MSHKPLHKSQSKTKPAKTGLKKVAANKENLNQAETLSLADDEVKGPHVIVLWGKEDYFHKTNALLSLIEDSPTWRQGFDMDNQGYQASLSLKSSYHTCKELLGETGHGLIVAGSASELFQGSEAANAWENIEKKFPWYHHMAALIGSNPNYSCKVISNSQSALDLSVLDHVIDEDDDGDPHTPVPFDDEEEEDILGLSSPLQEFTIDDSKKNCVEGQHKSVKKHKTPQDLIKEVAHAEQEVQVSMNESNAQEKTAYEQIKCKAAHDTTVELESMQLRVQQEEAAAQHAHELAMMDKQIQLALLQWGGQVGTSVVIDPQLQG